MSCPKCGRDAADDAVICPGCDFILDSSFLGDDIMDAEADRRVKAGKEGGAAPKKRRASSSSNKRRKLPKEAQPQATLQQPRAPGIEDSWAADSLILGDLDDHDVASFQASDTGLAQREVTMARMYVGGSIQALLMPDAIPEMAPDVTDGSLRLTPFERHVLELVNGKRPVARIKQKAKLKDDDFQTALALLADKGYLRLKARAKKVKKRSGKRPPAPPTDRTLIAEAPSAHELDGDERASDEDEGFSLSQAPTGPATRGLKAASDSLHREETLIQPAPSFDEEDDDDDAESERDKSPLSFADSIISEESVFASAEEAVAEEVARQKGRARSAEPPPKRRAPRRPPLPGEVSPEHIEAEDAEVTAPPSVFRSEPPPLPPDVSREGPAAPPAGHFSEPTAQQPPEASQQGPLSVDAADISLIEVAPLSPEPEPGRGGAPSLPPPPHTDPQPVEAAIEVSDFSEPVAKPAAATAVPPLPGGAVRPPAVPGARPPVARPVPVKPSPPPRVDDEDKSEEQPPPDSDSGEAAGPEATFEMQRKAARIFEQAEKDIAAGNVSSAIMNVKLALIYNPAEKTYRAFLRDWEQMQAREPEKPSKDAQLLDEASAAEQRGDYEKAYEILKTALGKAPKSAGLHNRIGVLMATRLKRYKEAAEHVLKAIDLAPGNLAYKNNLGKILAKEESAIHKMPMRGEKRRPGDERIIVKKLRPKLF